MATSGSADFNRTRNEIINRALRITGVLPTGQSPSAAQVDEAASALNEFMKDLQNRSVKLWTAIEQTQSFSASSEVTGTDGLNYTCIKSHTSVAGASGDEPITGIKFSDFWQQIGTAGVAWAALTDYGAIGDFKVAADTIGIQRAWYRHSELDRPMTIISENDYHSIADKGITAEIPQFAFFEVTLAPIIFLWPQPADTEGIFHFIRERKLEDFDAATNNPDSQSRWIRAISYGLADDLGDEYQIPAQQMNRISIKAERFLQFAIRYDREFADEEFVKSAFP